MEMFTFGLLCTCRTISNDISWSSFILENLSFSYSVLISDLFIFRRQESWCLHNGYFKYFVLVESQSTQPNESFSTILVLRATMIGANDHFDPFFLKFFFFLMPTMINRVTFGRAWAGRDQTHLSFDQVMNPHLLPPLHTCVILYEIKWSIGHEKAFISLWFVSLSF